MLTTEETQKFISALEDYAEQLVVEAYARSPQNESDELSNEVLKELAGMVEKRLIVEATKAVRSIANSMTSNNNAEEK